MIPHGVQIVEDGETQVVVIEFDESRAQISCLVQRFGKSICLEFKSS